MARTVQSPTLRPFGLALYSIHAIGVALGVFQHSHCHQYLNGTEHDEKRKLGKFFMGLNKLRYIHFITSLAL
jgi:hypothetical protein